MDTGVHAEQMFSGYGEPKSGLARTCFKKRSPWVFTFAAILICIEGFSLHENDR